MTNAVNFDSFFSERIVDNNSVSVTDINRGLDNLYTYYNEVEYKIAPEQKYLVTEFEDGYPDLVARNSIFTNERCWWWTLFLNREEDGLYGIKSNWLYYLISTTQLSSFINESNATKTYKVNSEIGKLIELN